MTFYSFIRGLVSVLFRLFYKIEIVGTANVPKSGRVTICANHTSLLDPIFVAIAIKRKIFFMAKKELFKNRIIKLFLDKLGAFPVDRDGADLAAIRSSIKVLKSDEVLGMFPEGTRVKEGTTNNVKPGIAMISIKGKSPVIPIYIDTHYKIFSKVKIYIGKPITFSQYFEEKLSVDEYKSLSEIIMDDIYKLKSNI